jgi:POT family proton-dependent oligopeptide transporter
MALSLVVFAAGKRTYADEKRAQPLTPDERRQRFESLLFILSIYGLFVLYFAFDQFLLPWLTEQFPWINKQGAKATAVGVTLVTVIALVARSVLAAGRRTFAVEKHDGRELTPQEQRQHLRSLAYLLALFGLVILFWFGYEHNDTLWIAFTRDYVDLRLPFKIPVLSLSWPPKVVWLTSVAPDQLQFLNALFVIILVPVFNVVFRRLDPKMKTFTPMRKILAGFILTAAAVGIMAVAGCLIHTESVGDKLVATNKLSLYWPAMAYIVLTFGEVLLYGTMLDLSYAAAPKSMKGYITACFLLTNTLANFLNILWQPLYGGSLPDPVSKRGPLAPGPFFGLTAAVTIAAALVFIVVAKGFERNQAKASHAS